MKIALVGYGQMGHMIEAQAKKRGHQIVLTLDPTAEDASVRIPKGDYEAAAQNVRQSGAEGIIEFSHPEAAAGNLRALLPLRLPLIVGTTGWHESESEIAALAKSSGGTVLRSSNFSLGVNLFYRIVEEAASLLADFDEYDCALWEAHHIRKADSPSGTAFDIAQRIMASMPRKTEIRCGNFSGKADPHCLQVSSIRVGSAPGTHTVCFDSAADTIELSHTARSREGFASGAVYALEKLSQALKEGRLAPGALYGMDDLL